MFMEQICSHPVNLLKKANILLTMATVMFV